MIGEMTYEEMEQAYKSLAKSSQIIREIIDKYHPNIDQVTEFCDSLDNYSKFLETSVKLYQDSDSALKVMIEKNKQSFNWLYFYMYFFIDIFGK